MWMGSWMGRLTARQVQTLGPGMHLDGDGLYLQVTASGARSWILRFRHAGKRRDMGLGPVRLFGLAEARQRALEAHRLLSDGKDPIALRDASKAVSGRTWGEAVDDFIASMSGQWKNEKHKTQWVNTLTTYGPDRAMPVVRVDTGVILSCLNPIWASKTETARRVRGRIERVWAAEKVRGTVKGDNPAAWKNHLSLILADPSVISPVQHFKAMPWQDVPAFFQSLGDSRREKALRFTILTSPRTSMVTGMDMTEVNGGVWTIPKERMKGRKGKERAFRIPLTDSALALLPESGRPFEMSENAMLYLVQKPPPKGRGLPYTVHGFRSSFRDWAADNGWPKDVAEMAMSHKIKDGTEAAYRRGDLLDLRRGLMNAWEAFLLGTNLTP